MDNTEKTTVENSLAELTKNYTNALIAAKCELEYWNSQALLNPVNDITQEEINKWLAEVKKYETLLRELLNKIPNINQSFIEKFFEYIDKIIKYVVIILDIFKHK